MPCSEKRARLLLSRKQAVVHRLHPFTIRLKARIDGDTQPIQFKCDAGSRYTGVALVLTLPNENRVLSLIELVHRGLQIKEALLQRSAFRRRRRSQLRHRPARFNNRCKPAGWLPPSVQHRVNAVQTCLNRLRRDCPICSVVLETVKFDMQKMQSPDIAGAEYQQGTLFQYEVREYLLAKYRHTCVYCKGERGDPILEVEHKTPKAQHGTNRIGNLVIACKACNQAKNNRTPAQWLTGLGRSKLDKAIKLNIQTILLDKPIVLMDAAAVNAGRYAIQSALSAKLPLQTGTGAQTKFNRHQQGIPKTHALDAVCCGEVINPVTGWQKPTLTIKAMGRGSYQRTRLDKFGFPRGYLPRQKQVQGFQTGDLVVADVPKGKKTGQYKGRVAVRSSGFFNIQTGKDTIQGVAHHYCQLLQRNDGFNYYFQPTIAH